jgi:hypothetical protein
LRSWRLPDFAREEQSPAFAILLTVYTTGEARSYRRLFVRAAELRTRRLSSIGDFSGEIGPIAGAGRE